MRDTEIDHPYAGLGPRLAAFALDFAIIAAYAVALALVATLLIRTTDFEQRLSTPERRDLLAFLTLILPVILYFTLQEGSARRATFGKRRMGLKVTGAQGRRMTYPQALLRSMGKFLPWQMGHTVAFQIMAGNQSASIIAASILAQALVLVYVLALWLGPRHRTPYDWLAGSFVVESKK